MQHKILFLSLLTSFPSLSRVLNENIADSFKPLKCFSMMGIKDLGLHTPDVKLCQTYFVFKVLSIIFLLFVYQLYSVGLFRATRDMNWGEPRSPISWRTTTSCKIVNALVVVEINVAIKINKGRDKKNLWKRLYSLPVFVNILSQHYLNIWCK